ncbi:hypothetical protein M3193_01775 [Sporosarcina luteola]|uniref:hypothetical protein n=1 Tax=Sporosarcina luteola TaxID=582850 RepID=UPI00203DF91C|nr:hypothetical protein [Sporosarcina luteola]MCM3742859.1 hypothetical protein [Sporosarcina luteola]
MQTVFLLFLFILQVIGFYFIALLYMKVSKFNNLEKKQHKLMAEMDDAIGAYLSELKEENDRLINIIEKQQENSSLQETVHVDLPKEGPAESSEMKAFHIKAPGYPMKAALKSYREAPALNKSSLAVQEIEESKLDDRTLAIRLHEKGKPIEEIAKRLGKGKTEVELLLKFR